VAFAQVREDPLIDRWVIEQCATVSGGCEVIQIASGGCTAAVLAAMPAVTHLHLVDPNPAQLALTRMKLWLLAHRPPAARLAILGHAAMPAELRADALRTVFTALALGDGCLGPLAEVARLGPDQAGRYERVFAALRQHLAPHAPAIRALLTLTKVAEQQRLAAPATLLGQALDEAFATAMALPNLVTLFGAEATGNAVMEFHLHFADRLRHVLATLPAATNPYLWQVLQGTHAARKAVEWLDQPMAVPRGEITATTGTMDHALAEMPRRFHVVHLSNILDWLSPEAAARTLALAWDALRPGGWVVIRQLNSSLAIPELGRGFTWSSAAANALHVQDRSFFYRTLHLGRKP